MYKKLLSKAGLLLICLSLFNNGMSQTVNIECVFNRWVTVYDKVEKALALYPNEPYINNIKFDYRLVKNKWYEFWKTQNKILFSINYTTGQVTRGFWDDTLIDSFKTITEIYPDEIIIDNIGPGAKYISSQFFIERKTGVIRWEKQSDVDIKNTVVKGDIVWVASGICRKSSDLF